MISVASFAPGDTQGPTAVPVPDIGWWKADAITGLADGAAVSSWPDSSAGAHAMAQATAGRKPTYKTSILNGLPVVRFVGTNTSQLATSGSVALRQVLTAFFVVSFTNLTTLQVVLEKTSGTGASFNFRTDGTMELDKAGSAVVLKSTTAFSATNAFHIVSFGYTGSFCAAFLDGASAGTASATQSWTANPYTMGTSGTSTAPMTGDIAEVQLFGSSLTTADRVAVQRVLGAKYAITVT